jgi:putative methionine-R-sulfoxide reductase with GAF domain
MGTLHEERDPIRIFLAALPRLSASLESQLAQCTTPVDVAWTLCDFVGRALELDDCVIYLAEPGGERVVQYAAWGPKRIAERIFENRIRLKLGEGVVGSCALIGAPQLVPDTRIDPRWVADEGGGLSELAVPMRHNGQVLGVIDSEYAKPDYYRSQHVRALMAVAALGAKRVADLTISAG